MTNAKRTVFAVCQTWGHELTSGEGHEVNEIFFAVGEGVSWLTVKGSQMYHCVKGGIPLVGIVDLELLDYIDAFTVPNPIETPEAFRDLVSEHF